MEIDIPIRDDAEALAPWYCWLRLPEYAALALCVLSFATAFELAVVGRVPAAVIALFASSVAYYAAAYSAVERRLEVYEGR